MKEISDASDPAALEALQIQYLGKKGDLTAVLRGIGALPAEDRPRVGAVANEVGEAVKGALAAARRRTPRPGPGAAPGRRDGGRHAAGPAGRAGKSPPDPGDDRCHRRGLRPVRLRGLRGARGRGRHDQLPDAQHASGPPGSRPVGHALPRHPRPPAPDSHQPGPDPGHAVDRTADPGSPARPLLPLRGRGRQPRLRVLPGRRVDGGRGDHPWPT